MEPAVQPPAPRVGAVRALAIAVAVLMAGGVGGAVTTAGRERRPAAPVTTSSTSPTATTATTATPPSDAQVIAVSPEGGPAGLTGVAGEIAAQVPAMMRFVAEKRGLDYQRPVEVVLLGDAAFRERLKQANEHEDGTEAEEARERVRVNERVLRALGLLERGIDLEKATESLLGAAVVGFYDTENDDLVVRGEQLTPNVRVTFVHELTHALQDQHFDLEREDFEDRDDEVEQAFSAVVEGDAVRIEEMYLDSLPEAEQKRAEREQQQSAAGIDPSIPQILLELISFPYAAGPDLVRAIVRNGGQQRLDDAFRDPPTTSEQVLLPDAYLADGEPPLAVAEPATDEGAAVIDEGVVGQLGMLLILRRLVGQRDAVVASVGWGGDRYVAWDEGEDTCVRTNLVMDTARDAGEMARALRDAAGERDAFDVNVTAEALTFTSCG